jgi:hypothetical protein
MHPYLRELIASEHARELRTQAQQARPHVKRPLPRNSNPLKRRSPGR